MWDVVKYSNINLHEDQRALEDLLVAIPPEMAPILTDKTTAKEAWEAITKERIGNDHAWQSTL